MRIDFNTMEAKVVPEFKGGEGTAVLKMYVDDGVRILDGILEPGSSIGMHTHEGTSETVYILEGSGVMRCDGTDETLVPGVCSYCPEGHTHSLINTGNSPLHFIGVVPKVA